jgi:broad specificity phosphatase PhoE
MFEIVFLRHGESEGVQQGILQGHLDLPLTPRGKASIQALAEDWRENQRRFDRILTSPLERARETAEIIAAALAIPRVDIAPGWIERDFGKGEGAGLQAIADWYQPRGWPTPFEPIYDSGETEWQAHLRAGQAIEALLRLPEGRYLVVSHGNILNAALHMVMGILPYGQTLPVEMGLRPGCFAELQYEPVTGRWRLLSFNR